MSCYDTTSATTASTYNWGQFVAVDGTPSQPGEPSQPSQPSEPSEPSQPSEPTTEVGYTVSASHNTHGTLYLDGTLDSGRFKGTTDKSKAAVFYFENTATAGQFLIYFYNNGAKTYLVFDDKAAGGKLTTTASEATVFEWNDTYNTAMAEADANSRAFGLDPNSTYTTMSCYDTTSATTASTYNWGQFADAEGNAPSFN